MENTSDYFNQDILLREIRAGNRDAFGFLFKNYYQRLYGYAHRFIDDRDTIEDILQECFLKIWERRETLRPMSILAFLFAIIRNECLDYLRHSTVVGAHRMEAMAQGEERLYYADFSFSSEYATLYEELEAQVQHVIDHLPTRCREVFLLSRFEGLKNREIAEKLGISIKAVEYHISKALGLFTTHFREKYPLDICLIAAAIFSLEFRG